MQAMCYRRYGGPEVLRIETVAAPTPGVKTCTHAVQNFSSYTPLPLDSESE
jgi:hypothetical protein